MARRGKRNSKASAISDRSGFRFPMSEMVIEPGTGWLVHKSESDGMWSLNEHPLNNVAKYLRGKNGDPYPVENARPRPSTEQAAILAAIPNHQGNLYPQSDVYFTAYSTVDKPAALTLSGQCFFTPAGNLAFPTSMSISCSGATSISAGKNASGVLTTNSTGSFSALGLRDVVSSIAMQGNGLLYLVTASWGSG